MLQCYKFCELTKNKKKTTKTKTTTRNKRFNCCFKLIIKDVFHTGTVLKKLNFSLLPESCFDMRFLYVVNNVTCERYIVNFHF